MSQKRKKKSKKMSLVKKKKRSIFFGVKSKGSPVPFYKYKNYQGV